MTRNFNLKVFLSVYEPFIPNLSDHPSVAPLQSLPGIVQVSPDNRTIYLFIGNCRVGYAAFINTLDRGTSKIITTTSPQALVAAREKKGRGIIATT